MAEVTLRNTRRQPFLATMYHDIVCRRRQACSCQVVHISGPRGKRMSLKSPASFQVDALSALRVDAAVMHLPQVKAAVKSGWLERVQSRPGVVKTAAEAAASEAAATPERTARRARR